MPRIGLNKEKRSMRIALYFAAAILLMPMVSPVYADSVVVPNGKTSTIGNDNSGSLAGPISSFEVEDVIDSGQFSSFGGPVYITSLAFRLLPNTGSIDATVTSFDIYLSTSAYAPNTSGGGTLLTTTFATNRGPDNTLVDSGGSGTLWSSTGCTGSAPCPFNAVFTFSTPFLYNPSMGDLLTDIQVAGYSGSGTGEFDVQNYFAHPSTAVVDEIVATGGSATGTAELSDSITQFGVTPAPEPSSLVLLGIGLMGLMGMGLRKKRLG